MHAIVAVTGVCVCVCVLELVCVWGNGWVWVGVGVGACAQVCILVCENQCLDAYVNVCANVYNKTHAAELWISLNLFALCHTQRCTLESRHMDPPPSPSIHT